MLVRERGKVGWENNLGCTGYSDHMFADGGYVILLYFVIVPLEMIGIDLHINNYC